MVKDYEELSINQLSPDSKYFENLFINILTISNKTLLTTK